jgi:hypothetical protein
MFLCDLNERLRNQNHGRRFARVCGLGIPVAIQSAWKQWGLPSVFENAHAKEKAVRLKLGIGLHNTAPISPGFPGLALDKVFNVIEQTSAGKLRYELKAHSDPSGPPDPAVNSGIDCGPGYPENGVIQRRSPAVSNPRRIRGVTCSSPAIPSGPAKW